MIQQDIFRDKDYQAESSASLKTLPGKIADDIIGNPALDTGAASPVEHPGIFCCIGTEELWIRHLADSAEIKSVGIKTGLHGYVCMGCGQGMERACLLQQDEFLFLKFWKKESMELAGQHGPPGTMLRVIVFVMPPCVMKNGEKLYNVPVCPCLPSQFHANLVDPGPVTDPVLTEPVNADLCLYRSNKFPADYRFLCHLETRICFSDNILTILLLKPQNNKMPAGHGLEVIDKQGVDDRTAGGPD